MVPRNALPATLTVPAKPYAFTFPPRQTALLLIDMQRDFLLPTGFGEIQGGNLAAVQASIAPTKQILDLFRGAGMHVFHTREGHKPDLSDCPSSKLLRQAASPGSQHMLVIGDKGPMGRLLTRGEHGHDLIEELQPIPGEVVIDKPGKGAFWNTELMEKLRARGVTHLVVGGVTTECCFAGTIREANDRGFECCGVIEATAGYKEHLAKFSLELLQYSQGLFGFVGQLSGFVDALQQYQTETKASLAWDGDLNISALAAAYRNGLSPVTVAEEVYKRIETYQKTDPAVWIQLVPRATVLEAARDLETKYSDRKKLPPLFGIPFSAKDSIDITGMITTTACPPLSFMPTQSAVVYEKIMSQGALFLGKTNLDQLATGLSGCRSPYGIPRSVFNKDYISGGSSSGSAVSVGAGLVSFSLATDTAGSGRVPALFNGIVGWKPTPGAISARGVTPACASLDCVSLMTKSVEDARAVWEVCEGYDEEYVYSKTTLAKPYHIHALGPQSKAFHFGIPPETALAVCSVPYRRMFAEAVELLQSIGGVLTPIDWSPFEKAGKLLYDGTFVIERLASLADGWFEKNHEHLFPVTRELFRQVVKRESTAVQVFRDLHAKALYTRQAEKILSSSPTGPFLVVVPTAPKHFTVSEMLADPIVNNTILGQFTHFGNVLDMNGISVPAGTHDLGELAGGKSRKLPFAVTLLGASRMDAEVLEVARRFEEAVKERS